MPTFELTEPGKIPKGSEFRKCWNSTFQWSGIWTTVTKSHVMALGLQWHATAAKATPTHLNTQN